MVIACLLTWRYSSDHIRNLPEASRGPAAITPGPASNTLSPRIPEILDEGFQREWNDRNARRESLEDPEFLRYFENSLKDRLYDWRQPISFWGIVLDDHEDPVPGAQVRLVWSDLSVEGTSETSVETDSQGRFQLLGKTGKGISISVEKDGYRRCRWGVIGFEYANPSDRAYHRPDPERPVLFRLIKRGPPVPLVHRERMEFRLAEDSDQVHLDLMGQRAVGPEESGVDLVVAAETGPVRWERNRAWFDWRVVLSVPDGGLQPGSECPPSAPEDGYVPQLEFSGRVEGGFPRDEVDGWFFVKSRGGSNVTRICLGVDCAPQGGGRPRVKVREYSLNPAGSLNLEFYPEMNIEERYYVPVGR